MKEVRSLALLTFIALSFNAVESNRTDLARIVRGHPAFRGQFPYMVRIYTYFFEYTQQFICGGALISANWVLTAAHCLHEKITVEVYLGGIFLNDAESAYNVPLTNIVFHPYFNNQDLYNDIALLWIPQTEMCDNVKIIPLPKINPVYSRYEHEIAIGIGWGYTNHEIIESEKLLWGRMKILKQEDCEIIAVTDDELCTAISPDWATIAPGDSGGPLVLENTGELIGIASRGDFNDFVNGYSAAFVRITSYLEWIKSVSGVFY